MSCLKVVSELSQSSPKIVSKLSKSCPKVVSEFSQSSPKVVPKLSQNGFRAEGCKTGIICEDGSIIINVINTILILIILNL